MTLETELARFDAAVAEILPEAVASMRPGLDDAGVDAFRRAVAPLRIGRDIEQLYRWHDGIAAPVFGGNRMRSAGEIIESREVEIQVLERPPAWLPFTDGPSYLFATLDVPDCDAHASVWGGDTHDGMLRRMHDSLEAMIGAFTDMATDASETLDARREMLTGSLRYGGAYRLGRSPGSFTYPDPPEGTYIVLFDEGTPEPWLRSLGTSSTDLLPRGATMTIADLREAAQGGTTSATLRGIVGNVGGPITAMGFTLDDGTGAVRLVAVAWGTRPGPRSRSLVEADVVMTPDGACELIALRWLPDEPAESVGRRD